MAISSIVAKSEDGTIQITFTIPVDVVTQEEKKVLADMSKNISVAGFRKGKAPIDKVKSNVNPNTLLEKTLNNILPKAFSEALTTHHIHPTMFPKFEVISQTDTKWEVRALTCEIKDFDLPHYKKIISTESKLPKETPREEKEQKILKILFENTKMSIPKVLIDEEVNKRLSQLLEKIEKLGLKLESYLVSIGKNTTSLREEYIEQTKSAITLELILNKIASIEKIEVPKAEIDEAIKAAGGSDENVKNVETRKTIMSILRRRKVLDSLTILI